MKSRSGNLPFALAFAFLLLVAVLMAGFLPSPVDVIAVECSGEYAPPNVGYDDCKRTQTADVGGGTSTSTSGPSLPTITSTPPGTRTVGVTPTSGATPPTAAPQPTSTLAVTRGPAQGAATPSPTSALPDGTSVLSCVPGSTVRLVGRAAPGTALLALFDTRPVGGGLSRADGVYAIELQIGKERPGLYLVEVRERATRALVGQFGCQVPGLTPTPTILVAP